MKLKRLQEIWGENKRKFARHTASHLDTDLLYTTHLLHKRKSTQRKRNGGELKKKRANETQLALVYKTPIESE